jgi:hypothetical protein
MVGSDGFGLLRIVIVFFTRGGAILFNLACRIAICFRF